MNSFLNIKFSYFPLTWMFHSRKLNHEINRMHDKCLRVVYNGNTSSYEEFLEIDTYVSGDHRNKQIYTTTLFYTTELFKIVVNGLLPGIMKHIFPLNNNLSYNTRNRITF